MKNILWNIVVFFFFMFLLNRVEYIYISFMSSFYNLLPVRAGNDYIDILEWRIGIAESDAGDIDISCLLHSLVISSRVSNYKQSRLLEFLCILVCQSTGSPTGRRSGHCIGKFRVFKYCALSERSWGYYLLINFGKWSQNINIIINVFSQA